MVVLCKHKSNVIDDCTNFCTKVIILLSDTFEELRKLIYDVIVGMLCWI